MNTGKSVALYVDRRTAEPARHWIVDSVDGVNHLVKIKRTLASPPIRWVPYNPDFAPVPGDIVHVSGRDLNNAVVSHKMT